MSGNAVQSRSNYAALNTNGSWLLVKINEAELVLAPWEMFAYVPLCKQDSCVLGTEIRDFFIVHLDLIYCVGLNNTCLPQSAVVIIYCPVFDCLQNNKHC